MSPRNNEKKELKIKNEAARRQQEKSIKLKKGELPDQSKVDKSMLLEPRQKDAENTSKFNFNYRGDKYIVTPVKEYEITGLVVSHNNPTGIGDIYHDSNSVDTKDLCIIWGDNLLNNSYQKVKFWNVSWTCNWRYPYGVNFSEPQISNNHLITDDQNIRDQIENVRVGDQIKIKGMLVNYTSVNRPDFVRRTSLSRLDKGNIACEVIFVKALKIIKKELTIGFNFIH